MIAKGTCNYPEKPFRDKYREPAAFPSQTQKNTTLTHSRISAILIYLFADNGTEKRISSARMIFRGSGFPRKAGASPELDPRGRVSARDGLFLSTAGCSGRQPAAGVSSERPEMVFRARLLVRVVVGSQEGKYMRARASSGDRVCARARVYTRMHNQVSVCASVAFVNPTRNVQSFGGGGYPCTWRERPLA